MSKETGLTTAAIIIAYELLIHIKVYLYNNYNYLNIYNKKERVIDNFSTIKTLQKYFLYPLDELN